MFKALGTQLCCSPGTVHTIRHCQYSVSMFIVYMCVCAFAVSSDFC